jgi:hypothetical protein
MTLATQQNEITRMPRNEDEAWGALANGPSPNGREAAVEVASTRAAQEVQAAMVVAKRFPRDTINAYNRIMQSCRRKRLAEVAMYEYPRGGQTITGPSIRLAEELARNWGNLDAGLIELERRDGESTVMAYCWDMETNFRDTKIFTVRHWRDTKQGGYQLKEERDIYELISNQGSRRKRACILSVIPGDIVECAVEECEKTLANSNAQAPLVDRIRSMITAFADLQVSQPMIEKLLGHKADAISERELIRLRKIYASVRDGMGSREQYFDVGAANPDQGNELTERIARAPKQPNKPASAPVVPGTAQGSEPAAGSRGDSLPGGPVSESLNTDTGEVIGGADEDAQPEPPDAAPVPEIATETWEATQQSVCNYYDQVHHVEPTDVAAALKKHLIVSNYAIKDQAKGLKHRQALKAAVLAGTFDLSNGRIKT